MVRGGSQILYLKTYKNYIHKNIDIRNYSALEKIFQKYKNSIKLIIHSAAQPSHDWAKKNPFVDFNINALGTLNLLNLTKKYSYNAPFIFLSTNKVYGDNPNLLPLQELNSRWEILRKHKYFKGINETMSLDNCVHSFFGVSKCYADLIVQEYGKNDGLKTVCFRAGCITGPNHAGARLHGFLSYLVKSSLKRKKYLILGYKGKQVRDNIHSYDVANFIHEFIMNPKPGEVYNLGGGRNNSISILEAFEMIENISGKSMQFEYSDENRKGDHICYISDLSKMKSHFSNWDITKGLPEIFQEIYQGWIDRLE